MVTGAWRGIDLRGVGARAGTPYLVATRGL